MKNYIIKAYVKGELIKIPISALNKYEALGKFFEQYKFTCYDNIRSITEK